MCSFCHACGHPIRRVLDGEEWCPNCRRYQRPTSHGWHPGEGDDSPCLPTLYYDCVRCQRRHYDTQSEYRTHLDYQSKHGVRPVSAPEERLAAALAG